MKIKIEIYGRNPSKYDIYINKDTGEIMTGPKNPGPNTEMEPTGYRVVNGKIGEGFKIRHRRCWRGRRGIRVIHMTVTAE